MTGIPWIVQVYMGYVVLLTFYSPACDLLDRIKERRNRVSAPLSPDGRRNRVR